MNGDRWRQVERLYHEALARPVAERPAFLTDACADNESLRLEVQALLDSPVTAEGFLNGAAFEVAVTGRATPLTGRRLGVYHVQERIGAGGMGEVYRARDTRLGRDVAIKSRHAGRAWTSERISGRSGACSSKC